MSRRLDGGEEEAEVPAWPAPERLSEDEPRRIERPLPVVAPSAFLRVRRGPLACGRSSRAARSNCARSRRVSRL